MANFVLIKENVVIAVMLIDHQTITVNGSQVEQLGIDYIESLNVKTTYPYDTIKQAFYRSNSTNTYAGVGDVWNEVNNTFTSLIPFNEWILNNNFSCETPKPTPDNNKAYVWVNGEWTEFTFNSNK